MAVNRVMRRTVHEDDFESGEGLVGGPTKSALRTQMHADVSNLPNSFAREPEVSAPGSTLVGCGTAHAEPDRPAKASGDTWGGR